MIEMLSDGLRVMRRLHAPRDDAFDAWVNRERLRAWFGRARTSGVAIEGALEDGHAYRLFVRHEEGHVDEIVWRFLEIAPPERLVSGWSVGAGPGATETVVAITFRDDGAFTEIELEHTGVQTDQQREMFAAGWEGCFEGLEQHYTNSCSVEPPSVLD